MYLYNLHNVLSFEHTDTFPIWKQSTLHGAERRGSISSADAARISQNSKEQKSKPEYHKIAKNKNQNLKITKEKTEHNKFKDKIKIQI